MLNIFSVVARAIKNACNNKPVTSAACLFAFINAAQFIGVYFSRGCRFNSAVLYALHPSEYSTFQVFARGMPSPFYTGIFCAVVVLIVRELSKGSK